MDEHDVAEVDVGLPRIQRVLTHTVEADHRLELGAITLLQRCEAQLPGVPGEDHAARDSDDLPALGVDREVGMLRAEFGQGVGAGHHDRIGVSALGEQALALRLTDPELLG